MVRREKKFYSEEFKERALAAYHNSHESMSMIAEHFGIKRYTFASWVYRQRAALLSYSSKSAKFAESKVHLMKSQKELQPEAMAARINELEQQLANEKMRSESLSKMIEIAERELKIDIRKKSGAKQSLK